MITENVDIYGDITSGNMFIHMISANNRDSIKDEAELLKEMCGSTDWCIAAVAVSDWDRDLTPWEAEPVFGGRSFGDGAEKTLEKLLGTVIPAIENEHPAKDRKYYLCGYSLAGLFSLWASYETDMFSGVVAASPSVWYPNWLSYAERREIKVSRVYLSLGAREEKAKNPILASVGDSIREQYRILKGAGVRCTLEWNAGNHFVDGGLRMAKGLSWMLKS